MLFRSGGTLAWSYRTLDRNDLGLDADGAYTWMDQWHRFSTHNSTFSAFLEDDWTDYCHAVRSGAAPA